MDPISVAAAPRMEEVTSPTLGKRSVELKRRSIEPAEFVLLTSAPKLHCTYSAKLVDLMSNFSVVDANGDAIPEEDPARGSDCSDNDTEAAPCGPAAPAAAEMAAGRGGSDDASSAISEQGALPSLADDEAASRAAAPAARAPPPAPSGPAGLAAVFERFGCRSIPSAAPADVTAAARAHLKEHPAACMDTHYVYDLAQVARMHAAWCAALPRVRPYYGEARAALGGGVGLRGAAAGGGVV